MRNSTTYKLAGTKTFRRSSTKILKQWGGNVQNIEKSMRAIYIPDGYEDSLKAKCKYWIGCGDTSVFTEEELVTLRAFLQVDQSGAEALIVAYDCEAGDYRKLFENNVKVHVYVALRLFIDIWKQKMKEKGGMDFDIVALTNTPIEKLKLNPNWKELDMLIKDSDNWSLTERYYYLAKQTVHCVDDKTEVLTSNGWINISTITTATKIAIYDGYNISMEIPSSFYIFPYSGNMYNFSGEEVDQCVTGNHKMVYISNGKQHIKEAEKVYNLNRINIPTSGYYNGGSINLEDWQIQLLVAIQADGYIESDNRVRFKFAKDRKIDRLHSILRAGKIDYKFNPWVDETTGGNIVADFGIMCPEIIKYFNGNKKWGSWLLNFSRKNLILLINELKYWDGTFSESYRHKREEYMSSIKENIDWIKTICHLVNKQGTIGHEDYGCIKLGINTRTNSIASKKFITNYNGFVYCPTVSTGMFLIRRNGKISITHNSANYDIQWATFIMNILDKSGGKIVIKRDQGEFFLNTYRALFPEIPEGNQRIRRQIDEHHIIYNLFGHPYQITNENITERTYKEYYAWPRQSTVAEITRTAFTNLQSFIEDSSRRWDILEDNHDSYLVQCTINDVKECSQKMKEFMNQKFVSPSDGVEFSMKSECQVGFNWGPEKADNPLGLRELKW